MKLFSYIHKKCPSNPIRVWLLGFLLSGCNVGPDYVPPKVNMPASYKEISDQWKIAEPCDEIDRGEWWKVFGDERLNSLMEKLNIFNQDIAVAKAQYRQAIALIGQASSAYAPQINGSVSLSKQSSVNTPSNQKSSAVTNATASASVSWDPDLWGAVSHTVAANEANAEASCAQLALVKLSMQASMAQYYFQLCALDNLQKILDNNVESYGKLLKITEDRYNVGVSSVLNIVTVKSQLEAAEVIAIDNGVLRAQYEHAIAVLIGMPVCEFSITPQQVDLIPPSIPIYLPSDLLERRPDIAQAERQMAAENEQIGVVTAAFFPTFSLGASKGIAATSLGQLLSAPVYIWSLGPQLAANFFDGGLLRSEKEEAIAKYDQSVASYRKTTLVAFQDVEDNLVSLRLLDTEVKKQNEAVISAQTQLQLVKDEYISGTAALSDVITAQINAYATQNMLNAIEGRRMVASVGLIKALGGGWGGVA